MPLLPARRRGLRTAAGRGTVAAAGCPPLPPRCCRPGVAPALVGCACAAPSLGRRGPLPCPWPSSALPGHRLCCRWGIGLLVLAWASAGFALPVHASPAATSSHGRVPFHGMRFCPCRPSPFPCTSATTTPSWDTRGPRAQPQSARSAECRRQQQCSPHSRAPSPLPSSLARTGRQWPCAARRAARRAVGFPREPVGRLSERATGCVFGPTALGCPALYHSAPGSRRGTRAALESMHPVGSLLFPASRLCVLCSVQGLRPLSHCAALRAVDNTCRRWL
jgi:hypothetical protein